MASLREALLAYLEADPTLMDASHLPGGIYDASVLPKDGLSFADLPMTDNKIDAFGIIRWRTSSPTEHPDSTERKFLEIWLYDQRGYDRIDAAKHRLKQVLNRTIIGAEDVGAGMYHWAQDGSDTNAEEYDSAAASFVRFYVNIVRR